MPLSQESKSTEGTAQRSHCSNAWRQRKHIFVTLSQWVAFCNFQCRPCGSFEEDKNTTCDRAVRPRAGDKASSCLCTQGPPAVDIRHLASLTQGQGGLTSESHVSGCLTRWLNPERPPFHSQPAMAWGECLTSRFLSFMASTNWWRWFVRASR